MNDFGQEMPDELLSIIDAAFAAGIHLDRLRNWMENEEWLTIQDSSWDVVESAVEQGFLKRTRGGVFVTALGMERIRADFVNSQTLSFCEEAIQASSVPRDDSGIPY